MIPRAGTGTPSPADPGPHARYGAARPGRIWRTPCRRNGFCLSPTPCLNRRRTTVWSATFALPLSNPCMRGGDDHVGIRPHLRKGDKCTQFDRESRCHGHRTGGKCTVSRRGHRCRRLCIRHTVAPFGRGCSMISHRTPGSGSERVCACRCLCHRTPCKCTDFYCGHRSKSHRTTCNYVSVCRARKIQSWSTLCNGAGTCCECNALTRYTPCTLLYVSRGNRCFCLRTEYTLAFAGRVHNKPARRTACRRKGGGHEYTAQWFSFFFLQARDSPTYA